MKNKMRLFVIGIIAVLIASIILMQSETETKQTPYAEIDWENYEPIDAAPVSDKVVEMKATGSFLVTPNVKRRDPSDIILVDDTYYVWYTKILKGTTGYPQGWCGTVWYATSKDGHEWVEQGQALDKGSEGAWDSAGVYTPNILAHEGKYFLAYTAMKAPFNRQNSQASIGLSVSNSPNGPWQRLDSNPIIKPSKTASDPDGFLCDDTVFIVRENKIWLYYKGYRRLEENGLPIRNGNQTYILAATADEPEGPYTKIPQVLHHGHEAVLWKDVNSVGSFCTRSGEFRYYSSEDGIHFTSMNVIKPMSATGLYRADFEEGSLGGARATWGIAAGGGGKANGKVGLQRFEMVWPE